MTGEQPDPRQDDAERREERQHVEALALALAVSDSRAEEVVSLCDDFLMPAAVSLEHGIYGWHVNVLLALAHEGLEHRRLRAEEDARRASQEARS